MPELSLKRNFSYAFAAQGVALAVGCVTNLILPRVLGAEDFSWWQLFVFYATYVPCLALGLNDGVYLRCGGKAKNELDPAALRSQYLVGAALQLILAAVLGTAAALAVEDPRRRGILAAALVYFWFYSCHNHLGYLFQARGETDVYSKSLILNKLAYLGGQGLLLALGTAGVFDLIPLYIGACGLGLVYLWAKIRGEFRGVGLDWRLGIAECRRSISAGLSLMLSNVCSMLVLGVGRQVVDLRWGVLAFGQISFSLTLINFALTFISQISMVLFPALRRVSEGELAACCRKLEDGLYLLLPWIYVLYLPGRALLEAWLPEYRESLAYLALVLPICYFDCKMNLVGNTFLKVLNRQTSLLQINLATILVSLGFALAGAWAADNMLWVVCGMAAAIALRSIWAGRVLHRALGMSSPGYDRQDVVLAGVFVLAGQLLPWWGMMPLMTCLACGRILGWFARR